MLLVNTTKKLYLKPPTVVIRNELDKIARNTFFTTNLLSRANEDSLSSDSIKSNSPKKAWKYPRSIYASKPKLKPFAASETQSTIPPPNLQPSTAGAPPSQGQISKFLASIGQVSLYDQESQCFKVICPSCKEADPNVASPTAKLSINTGKLE
ncbi:hypothetical protein CONCODRAFT_4652 [Conidiobolus coronatus NRRL 28638]|uniref:Uncharacterized protein n=1 Tax=Conidiobolus coronatus (strain ATCC 28846 / CBS 209.66 / NRRL 28638) TaxID=796925 RepID=A0A137PC20_CONC2|nr:hypothetical protein CONCODRAFT_4652 [Conidiobolus coronatus NRRL 28638]|eukprot:KXN72554.1 hypothetical protein CONCODRAFT_4652 [Conidiobolus coronatus NRRL 28638]